MISYSKTEYIPELKTMWKKIFGDSEGYLNAFFEKVYKDENALVHIEQDKVVSVLYMIPYNMLISGTKLEIVYLYALATEPAYRGRKIMSNLIMKSFDISEERNYALSVLIPAEDTLFEFYRKCGYEECFEQVKLTKTIEEIRKEVKGKKSMGFIKADASQIWDAYSHSKFFTSECIILSEEQNEFYIDEFGRDGGEAVIFQRQDKEDGYALLQLKDNSIVIYETNVEICELKSFYATLLERYEFRTVTFYQPICFQEEEMKLFRKPFAMSKNLKDIPLKKPFINRVLM